MKIQRLLTVAASLALLLPVVCLADTAPPQAVPELNPASASTAIAVIAGFGMLLRDRFRRR